MKEINVYSWYGADRAIKDSGLHKKSIRYSWSRVQRIIRYFIDKGYNVAIFKTEDYYLIYVSTKGFKQY